MKKDANGLYSLPRERWKERYDSLFVQFVGEQKKHAVTAEELRKANERIKWMETQMKILKIQNEQLRSGQHHLPMDEVA